MANRYRGGSEAGATLRYPPEAYVPSVGRMSMYMTEAQMRAEYSRLRSIARKRLERFEGSEFTDTQQYRLNVGRYKPLKEVQSRAELAGLLADVSRFVTARTGSVSGLQRQRTQSLASLHEHGYTFVNRKNFKQFIDFMEDWRTVDKNKIYDSARVADLFSEAKRQRVSFEQLKKDFKFWLDNNYENLNRLQELKKLPGKQMHSAEEYKQIIMEKW